jgi:hypothetical protein
VILYSYEKLRRISQVTFVQLTGTVNSSAEARPATRGDLHLLLAGLAWETAFIHVLAATHHYNEWVLYGVFFTLLAPAQAIWGGLVFQHGANRRLLLIGGVANFAVAVVWAISRTTGMPVGPTPWHAEAIGWHDACATLNELAMAGIVAAMLGRFPLSEDTIMRVSRSVAFPLLIVGALSASFAHEH